MTNTPPTDQVPHHLSILIGALMASIELVDPPPLAGEPGFEEYLANQALLQQVRLLQHHHNCLTVDLNDQVAAAGVQKALALIERSRTRITCLTKNDPNSPKTPRERDDACEFLKAELLPGPRRVSDLMPRARELGISAATLRRAKIDLNIASNLHVMPDKERFWSWSLPEHAHFANHNPPQPRPKCTMTDAEYAAMKAENDAHYAAQPPVTDDLGRPARSYPSTQSGTPVSKLSTQNSSNKTSSSDLSTQNSALGTSSGTRVSDLKTKDAQMLT